ncbi:hypothetical protein KA107_01555 [Candidatus Pacearchaeota archaeon]|nr:hypothetical protein [Candidatus Pacearchaeota archaeon]
MVDVTSALTTTMIGMLGVVLGAIVSNYVNQRIALKSGRRDIIFKKKMAYFEGIVKCIEENTKLYLNSIRETEKKTDKRTINKIVKKLKANRKRFNAETSPLYIDTRIFSKQIRSFVSIEKIIFSAFEHLTTMPEEKEEIIKSLKVNIDILTKKGNELISEMREYLLKE